MHNSWFGKVRALTIGNIHFLFCSVLSKHIQMPRGKRQKRDLHALNEDGMVMCNPRDKEAALRPQTEAIATENWDAVTCRKCLLLIYKRIKALKK
jgi:hypothetical protein